jgi:Domain of unknown function (DUF1737)
MKYTVAVMNNPQDLEKRINELISNGWEPQGGIALTVARVEGVWEYRLAQAMVKR